MGLQPRAAIYPYLPDVLASVPVKYTVIEDLTPFSAIGDSLRHADVAVALPVRGLDFRTGLFLGLACSFGVPVYIVAPSHALRKERLTIESCAVFATADLEQASRAIREYLDSGPDSKDGVVCLAKQRLELSKFF